MVAIDLAGAVVTKHYVQSLSVDFQDSIHFHIIYGESEKQEAILSSSKIATTTPWKVVKAERVVRLRDFTQEDASHEVSSGVWENSQSNCGCREIIVR